jgi:hypothetical protein
VNVFYIFVMRVGLHGAACLRKAAARQAGAECWLKAHKTPMNQRKSNLIKPDPTKKYSRWAPTQSCDPFVLFVPFVPFGTEPRVAITYPGVSG